MFLDYNTPTLQKYVATVTAGADSDPQEQARALYYAVRDGIFYEVYGADMSPTGLRASAVLEAGQGFCVQKSVLFAAVTRAVGIPSKIIVTEVRNHLASERMRRMVGGDVFVHLFNAVYLGGRWIKTTPVFNKALCTLYGMDTLEFDPARDSHHHPFDRTGRTMEFLRQYGEFDDLPYDWLLALLRQKHPGMFAGDETPGSGSLLDEAPAASGLTRTSERP
ncbi:transglutaminase-like domain-containing protein [Streptomyces hyaluromycini]|uniref:Transglutaminase-like domain-containing protein n=1 Tax=Streptomyces hyaluromycini TaxID=1377993 RepID=A0ABV1WRE6_9ACTN